MDKLPRPTEEEAKTLCKAGQGADCCRYLGVGGFGWTCLKLTDMRGFLDRRVAAGQMNSRGDNCPGKGDS